MKKLSLLIVFAFPFLLNAQYGLRNCHTDLVFGFDIGDGFAFINDDATTDDLRRYNNMNTSIKSFHLGTNIAYPIADKMALVTGFRLTDRFTKSYNAPLILHEAYTEKQLHDFYMEIPFRARYIFGYSKKKNRLYLEGGFGAQFYIASFVKDSIEETFGRAEYYNAFSLSANLAPGFEMESNQNDLRYFIQPIVRVQLTGKTHESNLRFYHVGLEMGIRF